MYQVTSLSLLSDRSLKEYEVEEEIGHGTYGTVYKAKDIATQEQVESR